ncbi:MAG: 30S ribosomal protein S9 [Kiritimatiellaeota bacterium]|nr:30S ribosomal protein S9 [Kiritimatiellota bacterium]
MPTEIAAATGRRKTSVARVTLFNGQGAWKVNDRDQADYFPTEILRNYMAQPLKVSASDGKYDITVSVKGGGLSGQAGAIRHALSRALIGADANLRAVLKAAGFLTRDSRMKERKKPGRPGARRRFQFSKR